MGGGGAGERVLFVCIENSGRSQMAEAFFEAMAPPGASAASAGTRPGSRVDPVVADAMAEVGIDMSARRPKALTPDAASSASRVVGMGCMGGGGCPVLPGGAAQAADDWGIEDPKGLPIEDVRRIRDEIRGRVASLVEEMQGGAVRP